MGQERVQAETDQKMDNKLLNAIRFYITDIATPNLTEEQISAMSTKEWIDDFCDAAKNALERMEDKVKDITAEYR